MSSVNQTPDLVLAELKQQTQLLHLLAVEALAPRAREVVSQPSHVRVYELTDGNRTTREIAAAAGVGAATVSRLWSRWARDGLVVPSATAEGRWAAVIPASRLVIDESE